MTRFLLAHLQTPVRENSPFGPFAFSVNALIPLHVAFAYGHNAVARTYLETSIFSNWYLDRLQRNHSLLPSLHLVIRMHFDSITAPRGPDLAGRFSSADDIAAIDMLLQAGELPDIENSYGRNALSVAIQGGSLAVVQHLLRRAPYLAASISSITGRTALFQALLVFDQRIFDAVLTTFRRLLIQRTPTERAMMVFQSYLERADNRGHSVRNLIFGGGPIYNTFAQSLILARRRIAREVAGPPVRAAAAPSAQSSQQNPVSVTISMSITPVPATASGYRLPQLAPRSRSFFHAF